MSEIIVIYGATASGKSRKAMEIAMENRAKNPAIINADALQLYSELPILSAQPSQIEQEKTPHFLYSRLKYNENSSVANWLKMVVIKINKILGQGGLPIVVGGTGLYIKSLISGINEIPEIDGDLRSKIREFCRNSSFDEIRKKLNDLGDDSKAIQSLDAQRLTRRLEVIKQTGKSLTFWQNMPPKIFFPRKNFTIINQELPREKLYENCNLRLKVMFSSGAIYEAENLIKLNPSPNLMISKTIGFLEIKEMLEGKISEKEAYEKAAQKTRNYAKRQLTWFRNQKI